MSLPKKKYYTSEDYWSLPESRRAELIDGQLYDMAPPSYIHQKIVSCLTRREQEIPHFYKWWDELR